MKNVIFSLICLSSAAAVYADTSTLTDEKSKVSYAIGMSMGHTLQHQGVDVDANLVSQGILDVLNSNATLLTPEQVQQTLTAFQQEFRLKQQQKMAEQQKEMAAEAPKNMADGEAFLAANKNNPGVVTLPDGLQYQVITSGTGAMPTANDEVMVNYRGTLIDGSEFDSSYKRGQPASFKVGNVIPGWTEALQKMSVGSKWKLFIPYSLAYGEQGHPPVIPPSSTLIFEVELLDVKSATPPPPVAPVAPVAPLTSDIIKVPSAEEMKKGAKIEVIKPEDAAKEQNSTN